MSSSDKIQPDRRDHAKLTGAAALIASLLVASFSHPVAAKAEAKSSKAYERRKASPGGTEAATEFPDDRTLPAIEAMRTAALTGAIRVPGLGDGPVEFLLRGYSPGSRATFEARSGGCRVAVKAYAEDPAPEAALYEALAAAGLGGESDVRIPPLLAQERDLRVLVIGWLEGPTARDLVRSGQGRRAGELAARWFQRTASLPVKLGPPLDAAQVLHRARDWAAGLVADDSALGTKATELAEILARTQPRESAQRLVHGTLYARHIIDLGDGPGVIDWQRFGQGPVELDAGTLLATISRIGLLDKTRESEAAQAREAFLAGTAGLLDGRSLAWHQAAMLLRLAGKQNRRHDDRWLVRAHDLLGEATRLANIAG